MEMLIGEQMDAVIAPTSDGGEIPRVAKEPRCGSVSELSASG